jgi:hypothetical protein
MIVNEFLMLVEVFCIQFNGSSRILLQLGVSLVGVCAWIIVMVVLLLLLNASQL